MSGRGERPVQGGPADTQVPGDRRHGLTALPAGAGNGQDVVVDGGRATAAPALGLGGAQAIQGPLTDQVAFHLRGHRGDHEQHLVGDGCPVRAVQPSADARQDVQVDAVGVQLVLQQHQQLLHRPGDPVWLVDHQGVTRLERGKCAAQLRPGVAGAGGLHHDLAAVRGGQGVELHLVVLRPGADPRVADPDAVVEAGGNAHHLIVSHTVPEPARRHAVPGLVSGTDFTI